MVKERKIKRAAFVYSNNNDYAVGLNKIWVEALKKNNVPTVASVSYSDGDTDFSAQVTKLKEANPDAIFFSGVAAEGGLLIRQAKQQGLNAPFVSGDGLEDATLFKLAGSAADGTVLYTGYSTKNPAQHSQTFVAEFTKKYGKEPQINNALAYDVVKIYAAAILKAGKNPDGIRKFITGIQKFPGVSGTTSFNAKNGDAVKPAFLEEVRGSKFELIKVLE
jgi:branched-chain amino acid transport system substrate-binding protein